MRLTPTTTYNNSRAATACRASATCWIDQDMGDDAHSVHLLSGGESFLVSLALGLASLSSNRVRVESLFIDESFSCLDAEALRVTMDALDGLQAMGRKVSVISHLQ
ncbi:SbcC/MukB-like Walker B domain-containing protein [Iodobacter sp. CM08]|uniref:SbcC/MukB-like Walker B domain-containing protein n=1 Tax=Iodobacter sp. CM08 TaxID=3085902 RepID=UPI0029818364|nr:SbcC/MukB-like Walker B domain-containing protein [Iodobacter sp. CM08]MDW5416606.1 SbcC/MukB-like Walker B domain-containing protein [Iodobacter sp. CM08]